MSPGRKPEALAGFDGGPRQHDATHALARERIDRGGDGEVRLARAGRSDADDDVVVGDELEVLRLARRLRLDDAAHAGQHDALGTVRCRRANAPGVMRSTSSASSGMRWRAASIMRWAIDAALSTDSDGPVTVSVSPRSATRAPVCLASSMRFASFTPASVSRSAPSTFSRCVIVSSGIRGLH